MTELKKRPRNIKETKIWQQTVGAIQQMWAAYLNMLRTSFRSMSREEQYSLITRLSQVITIGVAVLVTSFFYNFMPLFIRVFALPAIVVVAWWLGTNVVPSVVAKRFELFLKQD